MSDPVWERVNCDTQRLKIPEGWLYRCFSHYFNDQSVWTTPVFVPVKHDV